MEADLVDLAGTKDGVSERFVPDRDAGRLIEVEHVARYDWAAQLARGRRVLDAGCGAGYGSRILADAGAREVLGVDIAEAVLEAIRPTMPATVRLEAGDLRKLEYAENAFDLVVCFEVIEHFEDPLVVLDELVRVLAPNGILLISSPNRGVYPPGNPHHLHEFRPDELESDLRARLNQVWLLRQHDYVVSALLNDEEFQHAAELPIESISLRKLATSDHDDELYTIAIASQGDLPEIGQLAVMTGTLELREWMSVFRVQDNAIREKDNYIMDAEARLAERDRMSDLLVEAEQRLAQLPHLQLRISDLEYELAAARKAVEEAREETRQLDRRLMRAQRVLNDVFTSPSWQMTRPLRAAKKRLRS